MVPHLNIEHANKIFFFRTMGVRYGGVVGAWFLVFNFKFLDLKKREKRRNKEFEKVRNK